jgi:hypothetical protein
VKTVAEKARLKPGLSLAVVNPVPGVVASLGLPPDVVIREPGEAQLVFVFVASKADLESHLPAIVAGLAPAAAIWVFFRKGGRSVGAEVSRDDIWSLAERLGLRPLGLLSIDQTWSAFRLRQAS